MRKNGDRKGLGLVEILLAFVLMGVGLFGLVSLMTMNHRQMWASDRSLQARTQARLALARVAALPYDEIVVLEGKSEPGLPGFALPPDFPGELAVSVEAVGEGSGIPQLVQVEVEVAWQDGPAKGRKSFSLARLVTMPELGLVQPAAM